MKMKGISGSIALGVLIALTFAGTSAHATDIVLTATSEVNNVVYTVDLTTNTVTTLFTPPVNGNPDSLIYNGPNEIIYTQVNNGQIDIFNTLTNTNSTLVSGFLLQPRDLVLDPSGTSLLVSDFKAGNIYRVALPTGTLTVLSTLGSASPDGLAYDSSGHLFAVSGRHTIVQIDPTTGAVLHTSQVFDGALDGLTFDSTTGKLWVASELGNVYSVSTDFATITKYAGPSGTVFDGIEGDGLGNLFLGNFNTNVYEFNIASGTFTSGTAVPGIDDLAPIVGPGSNNQPPTNTPEPGTLTLLGVGIAGVLTFARRRAVV